MHRNWIGISGAAAAAAGLLIGTSSVRGQGAPVVRTEVVVEELAQAHARVTGSLEAVSRAAVAAQEPGAVASVLVDEGDRVEAGQLLATLDADRLEAEIAEAEATVADARAMVTQREAELAFAELDLERVGAAQAKGAAGTREMSEAETLLRVRTAQLDSARRVVEQFGRRVELLRIRRGDMAVRAPFDAVVVVRHVEPGEWIEPGDPVATLVSRGVIEARLRVPERFAPALLTAPSSIYVEVAADGRSVAALTDPPVRPVPEVDRRSRMFGIIVALDNTGGELAPGMSVHAWVPTAEEQPATLVPRDAVIRNGRDAYVMRITTVEGAAGAQSVAERVPVRVVFPWGEQLAVESDELTAGDAVVVEGNERLMSATVVTLAAADGGERVRGAPLRGALADRDR